MIVTNIQRFCLQDGPGIRTTVFLKGCHLRCPWCCNPETQEREIEFSVDGTVQFGKEYTADELYDEIIKDKEYFANDGGVTFSGGEPMWHIDELLPLIDKLHKEGITIAVETTGSVSSEIYEKSLGKIDFYLIDLKILEDSSFEKIRLDNKLYQKNVRYLREKGCNIRFRMPLTPEYTVTENNLKLVSDFVRSLNIDEIDAFETHEFGKDKYELLGRKIAHIKKLTDADWDYIKSAFHDIKINVLKW